MSVIEVIGTDEAGYGPNLGPLVIGASCWETPHAAFDFSEAFDNLVYDSKADLRKFEKSSSNVGLMVADSKKVYSSGRIDLLERGVLSFLFAIHDRVPETAKDFSEMVGIDPRSIRESACFADFDFELPIVANRNVIRRLGQQIRDRLEQSGARATHLSAECVFPRRFNLGLQQHGNKASLLTHHSLGLVSRAMARSVSEEATYDIRCDKHGGRDDYADAVEKHFGDVAVKTLRQSRQSSQYSFRGGRSQIHFVAKGESFFQIALASMLAKYTREMFMRQWNNFWQQHLPAIKPTKGYPVDAKRFKKEISSVQSELGIVDESIWRMR